MAKRLFIIGGTGFIGSEVFALAKDSFEVLLGSRVPGGAPMLCNVNHVSIDVMKPETLKGPITWADLIVDASAVIYPHVQSLEVEGLTPKLLDSYQTMFRLVLASKVEKFVYISSGGTIYGESSLPSSENTAPNPLSAYSLSKILIETSGRYFANQHGLPFVTVRPSNPYGYRQIGCQSGVGLIGRAVHCALNNLELRIYGDGSSVRDFLTVEDLAHGIMSALVYGKSGVTYNLGSGVGYSVNQVIEEILRRLKDHGFDLELGYSEVRATDLKYSVLDCSKAREQLFWRASTSLESGLDRLMRNLFK